jgi:hypothetical protein
MRLPSDDLRKLAAYQFCQAAFMRYFCTKSSHMSKVLIIEFQEQDERFLLEFFKKMKVKARPVESEATILARLSAAQREEWGDLKEALEWSEKRERGEAEGKTLRELLNETHHEHRQQSAI